MTPARAWDAVVVGCGTAGGAFANGLPAADASRTLRSILFVDCSEVEEKNRISCPFLGPHDVGLPKDEALARLVSRSLGDRVLVRARHGFAENLDWPGVVAGTVGRPPRGGALLVVLIGLDDWDSRLTVFRDVRSAAASLRGAEALIVQTGLDRGRAAVGLYDAADFEAPCNLCGQDPSSVLPGSEPCVLRDAAGRLQRGDLVKESGEAAGVVFEALADVLFRSVCSSAWTNTKTDIFAAGGGFERLTGRRARVPSCEAAHGPSGPAGADLLFPAGPGVRTF